MAVKLTAEKMATLGRVIRFHRKKARISATQLALIAGIGKTALYDLEQGQAGCRMETLMKICSALNITIALDGPLMHEFEVTDATN